MSDIQPEAVTHPRGVTDRQGRRPAGQPWVGLGGLLLAVVVFFALAFGAGRTEPSLLILGPMSTFALLAVAMIAFWWNDWPGSALAMPWTGVVDTSLVAGASVVLTIAAQAVVERSDLRGVFEANPGPGVPTTFPATLGLGGAAFTVMLQLSLVWERWPLSASRGWPGTGCRTRRSALACSSARAPPSTTSATCSPSSGSAPAVSSTGSCPPTEMPSGRASGSRSRPRPGFGRAILATSPVRW